MASVNYLVRIRLDEIHTQAINKTTAYSCYSHTMLGNTKVVKLPVIYVGGKLPVTYR